MDYVVDMNQVSDDVLCLILIFLEPKDAYFMSQVCKRFYNLLKDQYVSKQIHNNETKQEELTTWAARNGHFEILKWARENGCTWNEWTSIYAAKNGHFEILKWARENGCPWDELTCKFAANYGHLEMHAYVYNFVFVIKVHFRDTLNK